MPHRTASLLLLARVVTLPTPAPAQDAADPFRWLEEVEGDRAMAWVEDQNAATRALLGADPRYRQFHDQSLAILTDPDRIAFPSLRGETVYNFWTDAEHPRGIYRRTPLEGYLAGEPTWETVLDIDALAESEGVPWSLGGVTCLEPEERACLVALSRGGSDAVELREFDLVTRSWVDGGFRLPEGKSSVAWVGPDEVLVASATDGEPRTSSGYAAQVRRWRRGTPFSEAPVLATADTAEMGIWVGTLRTPRGHEPMIVRRPAFFSAEYHLIRDGARVPIAIPEDASLLTVGDRLVVRLVSDWTVGGRRFGEGSVVSAGLEGFLAGERDLALVIAPGERSTIDGIASTRDFLLVTQLNEVQGELLRFRWDGGRWLRDRIATPSMGSVSVGARSEHHNRFFYTYTSFVQPVTLTFVDEAGGSREVRRLPAQFDAEGVVVEQHHATSPDGTRVPYFVVRHADAPMDGSNPTLLTAYGGFQISRTPGYLGSTGKTWVERGGIYVLANIRGGGEFGPGWWKAALGEHRQRAFDDFIAVSEDLITRGITSPTHLGITGGSNGGLLVGVAMTQRPDLYDAVVVAVPLLDMLRYHHLLAGASWMAEYGNPEVPQQRAWIAAYSPYQHVEPGVAYPEALIWTTTRDDRVHPGHARKMAALLASQGHPVRYFENTEGGHGSGVTPAQQAEIQALTMTYLWTRLGPEEAPVP